MSDHDRMRAMAAGIMGGGPVAAPRGRQPAPSQFTPRSVPTFPPPVTSRSQNVPALARAQAETPPVVRITSPPASNAQATTTHPTFVTSSPPTITERNMNTNTADAGPLLRGDPEALKMAREFMQDASRSGTRPSRTRITSSRASVSSSSSTRSSPRVPRAQELLASSNTPRFHPPPPAAAQTPRPAARPAPPTAAAEGWNSFSELHNRPVSNNATPASTTAPIFTQPKQPTTAAVPTPAPAVNTQVKTDSMAGVTKSMEKATVKDTFTPNASTTKEEKTAGLYARQLADVNNTLTGRKAETPPHLRKKVASSSAAKATPAAPAAPFEPSEPIVPATKQVNGADPKPLFSFTPSEEPAKPAAAADTVKPVILTKPAEFKAPAQSSTVGFPFASATPVPEIKTKTATVAHPTTSVFQSKPVSETEVKATSAAVAGGTKNDPIMLDGDKDKKTIKAATPDSEGDKDKKVMKVATPDGDAMAVLLTLKKEVAALTVRVKRLETDNVEMSHHMEQLIKSEERRRFMGTDNAKAPFKLDVTYPNNTTLSIQVSAGDKIADLIRRARTEAKLVRSENPRIEVGGQQVGHSMTLGEVGVIKGANKRVVFCYDGADDEVL